MRVVEERLVPTMNAGTWQKSLHAFALEVALFIKPGLGKSKQGQRSSTQSGAGRSVWYIGSLEGETLLLGTTTSLALEN